MIKIKVKAVCKKCGTEIEPLCKENTDEELEEFYESNYQCECGIRIDWSNQVKSLDKKL